MSLADGRPEVHERMTQHRCQAPVRDIARREGDRPCGAVLLEKVVRIPAVVTVTWCSRCDSLER
jgi:hypothetical protein